MLAFLKAYSPIMLDSGKNAITTGTVDCPATLELVVLTDGKAALDGRISQLRDELATARQETATERDNAGRLGIELAKASQQLEGLQAEFETLRQARNHAETSVALLKQRYADLMTRQAELKRELEQAQDRPSGNDSIANQQTRQQSRSSTSTEGKSEEAGTDSPPNPEEVPQSVAPDKEATDSRQISLC